MVCGSLASFFEVSLCHARLYSGVNSLTLTSFYITRGSYYADLAKTLWLLTFHLQDHAAHTVLQGEAVTTFHTLLPLGYTRLLAIDVHHHTLKQKIYSAYPTTRNITGPSYLISFPDKVTMPVWRSLMLSSMVTY